MYIYFQFSLHASYRIIVQLNTTAARFNNHKCFTKSILSIPFSTDGYKIRKEVSKMIQKQMWTIFLCYFVTLSIYPGILSDLTSPRFGTWMPVLVISVFNMFDLFGKVITEKLKTTSKSEIVEKNKVIKKNYLYRLAHTRVPKFQKSQQTIILI